MRCWQPMADDSNQEAEVEVNCDCGGTHVARVTGEEGQTLEWTCPVTGELFRDPNI